MKLNLYDQNLNRIAIIGGRFISCMWAEGYNVPQSFTVELQATTENKKKVKPECYIGRDDRKTLMVIKTVIVRNGIITAMGKQAVRCLDDVPFIGTITAGSQIDSAIKNAYEAGEGFSSFKFAVPQLAVNYGHQISNKSILKLCETMCQDSDVGFRSVRNGSKILVEFYQPAENPNLIYSQRLGNLMPDGITLSTENWKNYAIVLGAGEGEARIRTDVDLSNGKQKRVLIVDARDLVREGTETEESYTQRLTARGKEKLLEQQKTWSCAFTPLASDFGVRYDLGDILTVLLPDYGLKLKARVTRFTQIAQHNTVTTAIEVGNITITR